MTTSAPPQTNLNTLPTELILGILDHLPLQALHSLNLTNRHLYNISLDHLYATSPGHTEQLLLRTIATPPPHGNPDLAKRVKNVICRLYTKPYLGRIPLAEGCAIADTFAALPLSTPEVKRIQIATTFVRKYLNGEPGSHWYFEFFLLFLRNVETLKIYDAWQWDDHMYWATTIAENATRFGRLRKATIHGPMRIENVVPFLTLPMLKELELWQVIVTRKAVGESFDWDDPEHSVDKKLEGGCSLEKLVLRESYIDTTTLLPIFTSIRGLKSFTYEHMANDLSAPGLVYADYPALARCLAYQATTLQHLDICDDEYIFGKTWLELLTPGYNITPDQPGTPGLHSLTSLSIGPILLSDASPLMDRSPTSEELETHMSQYAQSVVSRLAPTLHTLRIVFRRFEFEDPYAPLVDVRHTFFLIHLADAVKGRLGELKKVQVGGSTSEGREMLSEEDVEQLGKLFGKVGVVFMYENAGMERSE